MKTGRRLLTLVMHSLRRIRVALIVLAVLLAGFQFLLTQVASYLLRQGGFTQLSDFIPDFVRTAIGPEALAFMSFGGVVALGYFHPIVMTALVGLTITLATEATGEIETRFVDLTLARPLSRRALITRTLIVLTVAGLLMLVAMLAGTAAGLWCCVPSSAEPPPFGVLLGLAISLASVIIGWSGITLVIGMLSRRRAVAAWIAGTLAITTYLLDYLGRAWEVAAPISKLSPFHYFEPMPIVTGQPLRLLNVVLLTTIGFAGALFSYAAIERRDI